MRSLAQPGVLLRAAGAAGISALACYPRLATSPDRRGPVLLLTLILLWCLFVLWAFVIAWQREYARRPVLGFPIRPGVWAAATVFGVAWALLLYLAVDPGYRQIAPQNYPADWRAWVAMSLFSLAFQPLFSCFAPYAFFIRLARKQSAATALTVVFGVVVLYLSITSGKTLPPVGFLAALLAMRVAGGFITVYFYLRGGAAVVWWVALLLQIRLVPGLLPDQVKSAPQISLPATVWPSK